MNAKEQERAIEPERRELMRDLNGVRVQLYQLAARYPTYADVMHKLAAGVWDEIYKIDQETI